MRSAELAFDELPPLPLPVGDHQTHEWLRPGLLASGGVNTPLAEMVRAETGDLISDHFRTLGFLDRDCRSLAFVVHHGLGCEPGTVEISGIGADLPWSRPVLRALAEALFIHGEVRVCLVRACPADERLHAFLRRLGFADLGHDDRPGRFGRRVFTLDRQRAARFLRRRPSGALS